MVLQDSTVILSVRCDGKLYVQEAGQSRENREGRHGGLQATWPWGDSGAGLGDHGTRGQESWGGSDLL
ncbi:hypothetical protein T11_10949 [Trichinella zimbabwensis]|uniref:Uncharacterized protein n=1 Tax=Trichinella zimbabwensis TaxID=268475 RepID=A0A0V1GBQ4_9BILA|nr:hypothetical protein T11_10949 [Trichinella zimbabwensis]